MIFDKDTEDHWESISDLMTGLMVVFLFICLGFLYQLQKQTEQYMTRSQLILNELNELIPENDRERIGIQIDPSDLSVTYVAQTGSFDFGSSIPTKRFQEDLAEFFPKYARILKKFDDDNYIEEIRIEGNASRENYDYVDYFRNMRLTQDRAFNTLVCILNIESAQDPETYQWLVGKIRATGASFSQVLTNAELNQDAARTVKILIRKSPKERLENFSEIYKK